MSETLFAVIIGGAIAVVGSAATQLILFWLNGRRETQERRRIAIEHSATAMALYPENQDRDGEDLINAAVFKVNTYNDDQMSAVIGMARAYSDNKAPTRNS